MQTKTPSRSVISWISAVTLSLIFSGSVYAGFGIGAYPLSQSTVSMWILRNDVGEIQEPVLLVYFSGAPNWHQRKWQAKSDGPPTTAGKVTHRLISSDIILEIGISADRKTFWIQNHEFPSEGGNIFFVRDADQGHKGEVVKSLGSFDLSIFGEAPLSVKVLQKYPALKDKIPL